MFCKLSLFLSFTASMFELISQEILSQSIFSYICFTDDLILQEDLLKILPMINEANAMSEELNRKVRTNLITLISRGSCPFK